MHLNSRIPTVQAQESQETSHCDEDDEFNDSIVHRRSSVYEPSDKTSEDIVSPPQTSEQEEDSLCKGLDGEN